MVCHSTAELPSELFAAGVHPYSLSGFDITWIDRLGQIVRQKNCIAIGETGLDFRSEYQPSAKQQLAVMDEHIFLAQKLNKPLIIHCVKALPQVLNKLKGITVPFVFHGFTGSADAAHQIIEHGGLVSLGEKITHDTELQERVRQIELTKILLETDDNNTPIQEIYTALATIKNIEQESLKNQIEENFKRIFPTAL